MSREAFVHLCTFSASSRNPSRLYACRKFLESTSKLHKCTKRVPRTQDFPAFVISIFSFTCIGKEWCR